MEQTMREAFVALPKLVLMCTLGVLVGSAAVLFVFEWWRARNEARAEREARIRWQRRMDRLRYRS